MKFSNSELLATFPEAKMLIKEKLKKEIKEAQEALLEADRVERECHNIIYAKSKKENEWYWYGVVDVLLVGPLREGKERLIRSNTALLNQIEGKKAPAGRINDAMIEKAREYPIDELEDFEHNVRKCLFHEDNSPSLHYYKKSNTCYCFGGCGRKYDAIDVYMKLYNCNFIEAVKALQ